MCRIPAWMPPGFSKQSSIYGVGFIKTGMWARTFIQPRRLCRKTPVRIKSSTPSPQLSRTNRWFWWTFIVKGHHQRPDCQSYCGRPAPPESTYRISSRHYAPASSAPDVASRDKLIAYRPQFGGGDRQGDQGWTASPHEGGGHEDRLGDHRLRLLRGLLHRGSTPLGTTMKNRSANTILRSNLQTGTDLLFRLLPTKLRGEDLSNKAARGERRNGR